MRRQVLLARGANILKAMDELDVAVYESFSDQGLKVKPDDSMTSLHRSQRELNGEICGACGEPVFEGDRFCSSCGKALEENADA